MAKTCNCPDWPCCGHGDSEPSGDDFMQSLDPEERFYAGNYLTKCTQCGEMVSETHGKEKLCWLCYSAL